MARWYSEVAWPFNLCEPTTATPCKSVIAEGVRLRRNGMRPTRQRVGYYNTEDEAASGPLNAVRWCS